VPGSTRTVVTSAAQRERPDGVDRDHQPFPVPAVGGDPREQAEESLGQHAGEADDPRLGGRVRDGQDEQRIGDRRRRRPGRRQQLAQLQQDEVAVFP